MLVNGNLKDMPEGEHLLDFLLREGYDPAYVVVERNGREIITRAYFERTVLAGDDEINIVQFMGGG